MANCPTQLEFAAIDTMRPNNQILIDLYKTNKKFCAIILLDQGKSHRMASLSKTNMMIIPMD
jgi:hypothetical protein